MSAGWRAPVGRLSFGITQVAWSSIGLLCGEFAAGRFALESEATSVVDDAVENGVGDGRLTDDVVPPVDGNLAGDEGGAPAAALLDDLEVT